MLDKIGKTILSILQEDGRISNVDLAARVSLSPASCMERVRKLQQSGYITGFSAMLNPERLEMNLLVFIEVVLDSTMPRVYEDFKRRVQLTPEIQECHLLAGGFDFLLKARVKDLNGYREFLGKSLLSFEGIRHIQSYAVVEEVKHSAHVPVY